MSDARDLFSDEQLLSFNHLGLIPGPTEEAEEFFQRVNYCLLLRKKFSADIKGCLGEITEHSSGMLSKGFELAASAYDLLPTWIPVFFSNYQLAPWHGGCAWIFQITEKDPTAALLQLRKSLQKSSRYLGLYHRDELVAHELAHVGRMKFEEPRYEEIIAYRTSPSAFRRYMGPIVQSSFESMMFILVLALIMCVDIFLFMSRDDSAYFSAMWLKLLPFGMICAACIRLYLRQRRFGRSLSQLNGCLQNSEKAFHVLYRLTDSEIEAFSQKSSDEIMNYAAVEAEKSLRWHVIYKAYFKSTTKRNN